MKILKLHNWVHIIQITKENVSSLESLCVPSQLPCSLASHILPSTPNNGVTTILNWTYYSVLFTGVILIYTYLIIWLYNFLKFEKMVSVIITFFDMLSSITLCFKLDPDVWSSNLIHLHGLKGFSLQCHREKSARRSGWNVW